MLFVPLNCVYPGLDVDTDFYFETPVIYTLKQIITMYLIENRIDIK